MKKFFTLITIVMALGILTGCGSSKSVGAATTTVKQETPATAQGDVKMLGTKIKITVDDKVLTATLEDNAATKALVKKMPMTLKMENLYEREMCYRYGQGGLPTDKLRNDGYQIGDIAYWPPRGSLVILYAQNGERFERQQIGHIDGSVAFFAAAGGKDITFELAK